MVRNSINVLIGISAALIILFSATFNTMFDYYTDKQMHYTNQLNLKHFRVCYSQAKGEPLEKINTCLLGSLSSNPTGDAFVLNLKNMEVIWDNSVDCKTNKKMYLTKDSICKLANDPQSCIDLSNQIKKGYNSQGEWYFDDSKEADDWIILPDEAHNFDGSLRAVKGITSQYAVVQGNQYDEFTKNFIWLKYFVNIFSIILLVMNILIYFLLKRIHICNSGKTCEYQV